MEREQILQQEYDAWFDELRKRAIVVGFHHYGPSKKNFDEGRVDAIASAKKKMEWYLKTGNREFLVDAANYLMFEFKYPQHPEAHYKGTDEHRPSRPVGTPINLERNM